MRVLFVTPHLASPPRCGSERRLDGLMRGLAAKHEISLVSFVDPTDDVAARAREVQAYVRQLVVIPNARYAIRAPAKRLLQLRSLLSRRSYESFVFASAPLASAVSSLIARERFDVVDVEYAQMALGIDLARHDGRPTAFVLDEHNIEYDVVRRTASSTAAWDRRVYSEVNWRKLRRDERAIWRLFDGCATTSERDARLLREDAPDVRTAVVPNAVDTAFFAPSDERPEDPATVLFFGMPSYHPNRDALLHFLREILPRLRASRGDVLFRIVGPDVPPEIAAFAGPGVDVTGLVPDVRPYLASATVVVVPLRIGGGTRFKILEAMAMGKAVVSTAVGAEGIDVHDGVDIEIADEPDAFASRVERLIADAARRSAMGSAARALIERTYGWGSSVARLERFYEELVGSKGAR